LHQARKKQLTVLQIWIQKFLTKLDMSDMLAFAAPTRKWVPEHYKFRAARKTDESQL
jgi:hypothetical protein